MTDLLIGKSSATPRPILGPGSVGFDFPNSTAAPAVHRDAIEDQIERLIGILDTIDPSLGTILTLAIPSR